MDLLYTYLALLLLTALVVAVHQKYTLSKEKQPRRMSVFSEILAHKTGSFPVSTNIPTTSVHAAIFLDELPSDDDLVRIWHEKVLVHERMSSTIGVEPEHGRFQFVPATDIDVERNHLVRKTVGSETEILRYVESIFGRSWVEEQAAGRPLWYIHLITNDGSSVDPANPSKNARQSALVLEFHHAIGDGMSLMKMLQSIYTDKDGNPLELETSKIASAAAAAAVPAKQAKAHGHGHKVSRRKKAFAKLVRNVKMIGNLFRAAFKLLLSSSLWPDTNTYLKEPYQPYVYDNTRVINTIPPISLDTVKLIKTELKCSVNDVMSSALAAALRRYLVYRADPAVYDKDLQIRAMLPYAFPRRDRDASYLLRNQWILVSVPLPVGHFDKHADRVQATRKNINVIKHTAEPFVGRFLQKVSYHLNGYDATVDISSQLVYRHSVVFSNTPGFTETIYLCGKPVSRVQPFVTNVLPQFTLVSCNGGMYMNYVINPNRLLDAHRIGEYYIIELQELAAELGITAPILLEQQ